MWTSHGLDGLLAFTSFSFYDNLVPTWMARPFMRDRHMCPTRTVGGAPKDCRVCGLVSALPSGLSAAAVLQDCWCSRITFYSLLSSSKMDATGGSSRSVLTMRL